MTHQESSVKIYTTREYGRFKTINGNRELDEKKINRIEKDINNGIDVLKLCPIIVEEKEDRLHIIDGQHRFYVSKQLKTPVWYVISDGMDLQAIAKINSNTDKWKVKDFINCYVQQGHKDYGDLREMLETFKLPFGITVNLLTYGKIFSDHGTSEIDTLKFQRGEFRVHHMKEAEAFVDKLLQFEKFKHYKQRAFIVAVNEVLKADIADFDVLVKKFKESPEKLVKHDTVKEYQQNLEAIYNIRLKERVAIF